jgi:hypothetical protein
LFDLKKEENPKKAVRPPYILKKYILYFLLKIIKYKNNLIKLKTINLVTNKKKLNLFLCFLLK